MTDNDGVTDVKDLERSKRLVLGTTATTITLLTLVAAGLLVVMVALHVLSDVTACMSDPTCFRFG